MLRVNWNDDMAHLRHDPAAAPTWTYLHLQRLAREMFEPQELERLAPRSRGGPRLAEANGRGTAALDPIAATEAIAYDFLARGGKYSRPFITLAAYDSATGGHCTRLEGGEGARQCLTDSVRRVALSIESFHKASLVHDDIQDGDLFRYGRPSVFAEHGVPTAINVGDYLIGLGYRLVSRDRSELGAAAAADVLNKLADAHTRLSEGQGAELVWRESRDKRITPTDALKIYALKTAPAFEAALYGGLRLAGPADDLAAPAAQFTKHLGIAFQILNDLQDWQGDGHNKLARGGDVLGGRPTVLWALALAGLPDHERHLLERYIADGEASLAVFDEIRSLYERAGAFDEARRLVNTHQERAAAAAEQFAPEELRRLARYLIDTVLARPAAAGSHRIPLAIPAR
jgi:geranylgeranyl pyrophosphate synthase